MASITVSIPDTMKQEMERLDEVNWSAVARNAFQERLEEQKLIKQFKQRSDATEADAIELGRQLKANRSS